MSGLVIPDPLIRKKKFRKKKLVKVKMMAREMAQVTKTLLKSVRI